MVDATPDIAGDTALRQLTAQAQVLWGADYATQNPALLEQAAAYVAQIANNLPDTETEPGFYQ